MITVTQTRKQIGSNYVYDFGGPTERTSLEALKSLVVYELGYGGQITNLDYPTRIKVETRILSKIDTAVFEGSKEEMKPLFEATYFFLKATTEHSDLIVENAVAKLNRELGELAGIPFYLEIAGPMVIGETLSKVALMLGLGVTAEEDVKKGIALSTKDLVTVFELREANPELPFSELIQLAS